MINAYSAIKQMRHFELLRLDTAHLHSFAEPRTVGFSNDRLHHTLMMLGKTDSWRFF